MSKISAVICELNPAHSGHKFIFDCAREYGDTVVAIMSGNFVQRGENAIYDKYKRAESALEIGADLVIELPFPWCSASAEFFSRAAVEIAKNVGADNLVFGSECGDKEALYKAAEMLKREEFNSAIPADIRAAEYREDLLRKLSPDLPKEILSSANDILGIEYIKNAGDIKCIPVKRISCESATAIRENINSAPAGFPGAIPSRKLFELEYIKLRTVTEPSFVTAESNGGVGDRLYKSACKANSGSDMFEMAKTKQYTNARLRRCALYFLMGVKDEKLRDLPLYTQVLAFNSKGRELLANLRKQDRINILTKPSAFDDFPSDVKKQVIVSQFADSIYTLLSDEYAEKDYFIKQGPVKK